MPAHHRRTAAVGLAVAALAAGALSASPSATAVESAVSDSPIVLDAPEHIKVRSHDGHVYSDFGLAMVAQGEDFEIRANRPTYDDPITAVWHTEAGTVDLPAGSMTTWQGLDDFAKVVIKRDGGRRKVVQVPGCFNSWDSRAVVPDHAAGNKYPWSCPYNPYTLGSVMGISKGHAVSALGGYGYYATRLKPGSYTVKMTIAPQWREQFGISDADGAITRPMTVKKARNNNWRPAPSATAPEHEPNQSLEESGRAPAVDSRGALADEHAPDLRSLPAFQIGLNGKGTAVRFGANVWNGGNGPMVVEGYEPDEDGGPLRTRHDGERHLDAYQYYYDGDGEITGHDLVGEFTFHEGNHNHWHFEDFAAYTLLADTDEDGEPDAEAVRSNKVSFCLANTDAVDYTLPNAEWRPGNTDLGSDCGGRSATYLRQVLDTGSGDTYYQFRTGQSFRVSNLPDGDYWISVNANPEGNLTELDTTNNESLRKITLRTTKRGVRKVSAEQVGIIDESWGYGFRSAR